MNAESQNRECYQGLWGKFFFFVDWTNLSRRVLSGDGAKYVSDSPEQNVSIQCRNCKRFLKYFQTGCNMITVVCEKVIRVSGVKDGFER